MGAALLRARAVLTTSGLAPNTAATEITDPRDARDEVPLRFQACRWEEIRYKAAGKTSVIRLPTGTLEHYVQQRHGPRGPREQHLRAAEHRC